MNYFCWKNSVMGKDHVEGFTSATIEVTVARVTWCSIVAASRSKVGPLPKKFKLLEDNSRIDPDASTEVRIEELENLAVMQSVTVHVKTMLVGVPGHVQVKDSWRRLTKQECVVGDANETIWKEKRTLVVYNKIAAVRLQMHMSKPLKGRNTFQCMRKVPFNTSVVM